jgi:hypothetical protein
MNQENKVINQLLEALNKINNRAAFIDKGVNYEGDTQISDIWEIAHEALNEFKTLNNGK